MQVILRPKEENEVLYPVAEKATPEDIRDGIITKAQCVVDHLCGCK